MAKSKEKPYTKAIKNLMADKSRILSKAQTLDEMGLVETALPLWASAASFEERIAPSLETLGRELEAAVHRISAASCYEKSGELYRAANLYRAALSGPLPEKTLQEIQEKLSKCLVKLTRSAGKPNGKSRARKAIGI